MAVLFLVGHEQLNHLVPRAGEAVQAAGGDGSTQLIERQRGAENLDSFTQTRVVETFREPTLGLHLVDEIIGHFVLFLQGLQHGPDFVELGPRDGGVQRFARRHFQPTSTVVFCGLRERQRVNDGAINLWPIHRIDFDRFALGIAPLQVVVPRRRRQEQPLANWQVFVLVVMSIRKRTSVSE